MKKSYLVAEIALSGLLLYVSLAGFIPTLTGQNVKSAASLSPEQSKSIAIGEASKAVISKSEGNRILTPRAIQSFSKLDIEEIFPHHLIYEDISQIPESQKDYIAIQQRVALLENQIKGLSSKLDSGMENDASKSFGSWIRKFSWSEAWWGALIWIFGTIFTVSFSTVIRHVTEKLILKK